MSYYRKNTPKPLSELVKGFLDDFPHRKRLKKGMILSLWGRTVGSRIAGESTNLHFEYGKLVVHVSNPAWRQEIHMKRFSIAKRLNDQVNEKIIDEIIVRS